MSTQPFSDDQPQVDHPPSTLHRPDRGCHPLRIWWAMTGLLILVTLVSSTVLAGWLFHWFPPPARQSLPKQAAPSMASMPLGPWDSRPCVSSPSPITCDGRLATAPEDMQIFAHPQGSGVCFDKDSIDLTQNIVVAGSKTYEVLGHLTLWWLPRCQSHAALVSWSGDGSAELSVELRVLHPGVGPWQADEGYTAIYASGKRIGNAVWSVLVWSPAAAFNVVACGTITWREETGSVCSPQLA